MTEKPRLYQMPEITFGADPEFFFSQKGRIIGAEKVIDSKFMLEASKAPKDKKSGYGGESYNTFTPSRCVIDGVQVEINTGIYTCRAGFTNEIAATFRALSKELVRHKGVVASFAPVIEVEKEELESLSEASRRLGCAPSFNQHDPKATINVDPMTYRTRSAGGHIHIGWEELTTYGKNSTGQYVHGHHEKLCQRLVVLLDVLLGNTCVLLDRGEAQRERRKVYGRAGEYRLPKHGIEYRTLSNFWLRSCQLTSFVLAMTRMACAVLHGQDSSYHNRGTISAKAAKEGRDFEEDLLSRVDLSKVVTAINENDFDLALANYQGVRTFIEERIGEADEAKCLGDYTGGHPLWPKALPDFDYFLTKDISYWFPEDPLTHWCSLPETHRSGWESFLIERVRKERLGGKKTPPASQAA